MDKESTPRHMLHGVVAEADPPPSAPRPAGAEDVGPPLRGLAQVRVRRRANESAESSGEAGRCLHPPPQKTMWFFG